MSQPAKRSAPNPPTISKTSLSTFDECERKWALQYADPQLLPENMRRDVRFQRKLMENVYAFAGQVVDDVITHAFRNFAEAGWPQDYAPLAKMYSRQYVEDSQTWLKAYREGRDTPRIARQPLAAYFFEEPYTDEDRAAIRDAIQTCLSRFWASKLLQKLLDAGPKYWDVRPENIVPWFYSDEVPVYARYDFALRMPGKTVVYDWKTGKVREQDAKEQLHTYAAFAMKEWGCSPEELRVCAVWLAADPDLSEEEEVDLEFLRQLREKWRERHTSLVGRMKACREEGKHLFELFPMTGIEKRKCPYCTFRSCEGYAIAATRAANAPQSSS